MDNDKDKKQSKDSLDESTDNNDVEFEEDNKEVDTLDNDKESLKNDYEEVEKNKLSRKKKICIGVSIFLGVTILVGTLINNKVTKYEDIVYPGNNIYGKDISKFTNKEVLSVIESIEKDIKQKNISIEIDKNKYTIALDEIIYIPNKEELSNEIIDIGKEGSIFKKYINIVTKQGINYELPMEIEEEILKEKIQDIASEINKEATLPSIVIEDEAINIKEGKLGIALNEEEMLKVIKESILNSNENESTIEVSSIIQNTKPPINIDDLKRVDTKISQYSTYYGGSTPRGTNIEVAAKKLDDLILMPGDEFSYENSIGPVSASNGYKEASVIINGKIENGIGGGVCQVSSTLYNAQLKAGILPTERRNHSRAVDYVPRGLDATLASGSIDYKFRNTYDYPLVINTYTDSGYVYIEIWSNKDATEGITYEAISYISGKKADSYLYGYDSNGKKVYEKFIDTSIYR